MSPQQTRPGHGTGAADVAEYPESAASGQLKPGDPYIPRAGDRYDPERDPLLGGDDPMWWKGNEETEKGMAEVIQSLVNRGFNDKYDGTIIQHPKDVLKLLRQLFNLPLIGAVYRYDNDEEGFTVVDRRSLVFVTARPLYLEDAEIRIILSRDGKKYKIMVAYLYWLPEVKP